MAAAPAAARWHLPTRRLRSLIPPRKQSPAADGRLQTRTNASVRLTFFGRRHRAPPSLDACCYFSRGGTLRARPAEAAAPRAPGAPAASSPCPAATCPRAQGKAGAAGAPLPQTRSGRSFPLLPPSLLLFYFFIFLILFEIPFGVEELVRSPQPVSKAAEKEEEIAVLLTAQQSPCRRAPCSFPFSAPPRRQQRGEEAEQTGQPRAGRAAGGREGGLAGWLFFPRSPSVSLRRPPVAKRLLRAAAEPPPGSRPRAGAAALTRRREPPRPPLSPLTAPSSLRPRSAEGAAGRGPTDAGGTRRSAGGGDGPRAGSAGRERRARVERGLLGGGGGAATRQEG